jgi:hypothetical protein
VLYVLVVGFLGFLGNLAFGLRYGWHPLFIIVWALFMAYSGYCFLKSVLKAEYN